MNHKRLIGSALVAAGLFLAGCGGVEDLPEAQPDLATHEQAETVICSDQMWQISFYSDAAMTNEVGYLRCDCYSPQTRGGEITNYQRLIYNYYCSLD